MKESQKQIWMRYRDYRAVTSNVDRPEKLLLTVIYKGLSAVEQSIFGDFEWKRKRERK